jgi:hypothetical protein
MLLKKIITLLNGMILWDACFTTALKERIQKIK